MTEHNKDWLAALGLHLLPALMLLAALGPWPYQFYMGLRLVVCLAAVVLAFVDFQFRDGRHWNFWTVVLCAIAIVFNPIVPAHLTREIWAVLNVLAAAAFIAHFTIKSRRELNSHWNSKP